MPRNQSIAEGVKENRRLVTFSMEKADEFLEHLKTRYNSEIIRWFYTCPRNDWKYEFLRREITIREKKIYLKRLEELAAVW
jgi:hypothetical protein